MISFEVAFQGLNYVFMAFNLITVFLDFVSLSNISNICLFVFIPTFL